MYIIAVIMIQMIQLNSDSGPVGHWYRTWLGMETGLGMEIGDAL